MEGYVDWLAILGNIGKALKIWGRISRILIRDGADPKVLGHFYKAVAQAVLLFGLETWVLTLRMERAMDSFQHRVARRLTGILPSKRGGGSWAYPPFAEAMGESGLEGIRKSVTRRQNMVAHYIVVQTILDLCEPSTWRPRARVFRRW